MLSLCCLCLANVKYLYGRTGVDHETMRDRIPFAKPNTRIPAHLPQPLNNHASPWGTTTWAGCQQYLKSNDWPVTGPFRDGAIVMPIFTCIRVRLEGSYGNLSSTALSQRSHGSEIGHGMASSCRKYIARTKKIDFSAHPGRAS